MGKGITKVEVIQQLSTMLRREELSDVDYLRLLTVYMKLSNWVFPITPTPSKVAVKVPSPLEIVLEAERKRRAEGLR